MLYIYCKNEVPKTLQQPQIDARCPLYVVPKSIDFQKIHNIKNDKVY